MRDQKRPEVKTWWNKPILPKLPGRKSITLTIPDQALSVKEIIQRYSSGRTLPQSRVPQYSNEDWDIYQKMDRIDRIDSLKNVNEFINQTKNTPPPQQNNNDASERPSNEGASEQGNN